MSKVVRAVLRYINLKVYSNARTVRRKRKRRKPQRSPMYRLHIIYISKINMNRDNVETSYMEFISTNDCDSYFKYKSMNRVTVETSPRNIDGKRKAKGGENCR